MSQQADSMGRKLNRIYKRDFDTLETLLTLSGEWQLRDADIDMNNSYRSFANTLVRNGALERVERRGENTEGSIYRWDPDVKAQIEAYAEQVARLPCGCRAHVPPGDDAPSDWYACKHCGVAHSRQAVREAMD